MASNYRVGNAGFDVFEFGIAHNDEARRPRDSYGGLSGGAVWKTGETGGPNDRIVVAIAYRESNRDPDGNRFIICQGRRCIYRQLVDKGGQMLSRRL